MRLTLTLKLDGAAFSDGGEEPSPTHDCDTCKHDLSGASDLWPCEDCTHLYREDHWTAREREEGREVRRGGAG